MVPDVVGARFPRLVHCHISGELGYRPAVIDRLLGGACGTDMTAIHTKGTERC